MYYFFKLVYFLIVFKLSYFTFKKKIKKVRNNFIIVYRLGKNIVGPKDVNNFSYKNEKNIRNFFSYKILFEKNFDSIFYFTYFCIEFYFFSIKMN